MGRRGDPWMGRSSEVCMGRTFALSFVYLWDTQFYLREPHSWALLHLIRPSVWLI